jgi:hypothetical protein
MTRLFAGLFIVTVILLSSSNVSAEILQQSQVPLELRILNPGCTIDSVNVGISVATTNSCPYHPDSSGQTTPDPGKPHVPGVDDWAVGAPNTGFLRTIVKSSLKPSVWLALTASLVFMFAIFRIHRKKSSGKPRRSRSALR